MRLRNIHLNLSIRLTALAIFGCLLPTNFAIGDEVTEIKKQLQGTWKLAETKHSDRDWSDAVVFDVHLVFDGDRLLTKFETHLRPPTEIAEMFEVVAVGKIFELRHYSVFRNTRQNHTMQKAEFIIHDDSLIIARQFEHGKARQAGTTTIERIQAFRRSEDKVDFSEETLANFKPLADRTKHRKAEAAIRQFLQTLLLGDKDQLKHLVVENTLDGFVFREGELGADARKNIKIQIASMVARDVTLDDKLYDRNGTPISLPKGEEVDQNVALVPIVNGADWNHAVLVTKKEGKWIVDATPFAMKSRYQLRLLHGIYLSMTLDQVREIIANDPGLTLLDETNGQPEMLVVQAADKKKWPVRKLSFVDRKLVRSQNAAAPNQLAN